MQNHQYANLFPMMNEDELNSLISDMRQNGYDESSPITTHENKILDGRNRYKAAQSAGVTPVFVKYDGDDPLGFVLRHNLHRRHLNESQRAVIASRLANMERGGNGSNQFSKSANLQNSNDTHIKTRFSFILEF